MRPLVSLLICDGYNHNVFAQSLGYVLGCQLAVCHSALVKGGNPTSHCEMPRQKLLARKSSEKSTLLRVLVKLWSADLLLHDIIDCPWQ